MKSLTIDTSGSGASRISLPDKPYPICIYLQFVNDLIVT